MGLALDGLYSVAAVVGAPAWAYRLLRTGKWRTDWPGRFGRCPNIDSTGHKRLLIHAVSVGEVNAIRLLAERLAQSDPTLEIVFSATTDTGMARAKQLFEPRHQVVRYPLDLTRCVRRFLDAVRPDAVALVENEVWPNFTEQCARRGIALCVVNGRLTTRSFKRYNLIRPIALPMYGRLNTAAVQTQTYACHFTKLGVPTDRIHVYDTMKWDTAKIADHVDGAEELARAMGLDRSRQIIVAGSTGPGEEKLLINTCPPSAQLVLVPRKPERFEQVAQLATGMIRRTQHQDGSKRAVDGQRLFMIDTIGELRKAYALADAVIVGRSFLGMYGSDMMEPIALGKATIIGPHHSDFVEIVDALQSGGGIVVTDDPGPVVADLLHDRQRAARLAQCGRDVISARQGATDRHVQLLRSVIKPNTRHANSDPTTAKLV